MNHIKPLLAICFTLCIACSNSNDPEPNGGSGGTGTGTIPADITKKVSINTQTTYQTMDGFAASDCWTANYVGRDWADDQKESIARLLFSKEIKNGTPQGIGLSMWRFNLGAGTAEQGDNSGISDKSRRAECFLNVDGTYNWNKHQGQQYFLEKAREYGCESFVMFSNSPPVHYTQNGKGYSNKGVYSNLKAEHYTSFANYMATVASYFKQKGIDIAYISPVNEPQYDWNGGQEGSGWQNSEVKKLVVELDKSLSAKSLDTKILVGEAGDWEYLYKVKGGAGRSNTIEAFFTPGARNYIGDLPHVPQLICGHSYWTDGSWSSIHQTRSQVGAATAAKGLKVYQTEWSMLGDDQYKNIEDYPGHEQATYFDIALHQAKIMHHDLTAANVSSWSYWTAMDMERWDHKNRFLLISLTPAGGAYGDISGSGTHQAMKNLWVLGNYSLFIRPGYQRVDLNVTNPSNTFFGSAWISPDKKQLAVVFTNLTSKSVEADLTISGLGKYTSLKRYVTSSTKNLKEDIPQNDNCIVEPQSVTTFVFTI